MDGSTVYWGAFGAEGADNRLHHCSVREMVPISRRLLNRDPKGVTMGLRPTKSNEDAL
jgi:hypothetical protein